jgi:sugar O-acyltransferase (sialic acid O-acetyltransferase NeuD family)
MKARKRVGIIAGGGHGRNVRELVVLQEDMEPVGFYDDDPNKWGQTIDGTPVLGPVGELSSGKRPVDGLVIAIGFDNRRRAAVFDEMRGLGYEMVSVIHPHATISASATHGIGLVAFAGTVMNAGARIGEDVLIGSGVIVDHDCRIGNHCCIFVGAVLGGGVQVGPFALIGQSAAIGKYLSIGEGAVIGDGVVIRHDIEDGATIPSEDKGPESS